MSPHDHFWIVLPDYRISAKKLEYDNSVFLILNTKLFLVQKKCLEVGQEYILDLAQIFIIAS